MPGPGQRITSEKIAEVKARYPSIENASVEDWKRWLDNPDNLGKVLRDLIYASDLIKDRQAGLPRKVGRPSLPRPRSIQVVFDDITEPIPQPMNELFPDYGKRVSSWA